MMKRMMILAVVLLAMVWGVSVSLKGAQAGVETLPDPTVYVSEGTIVVTSTLTPVAINSQTLSQTVLIEGTLLWQGSQIPSGTVGTEVLVTSGNRVEWVSVWDLQKSEVYTDANGVSLETNPEDWGRTGVVRYRPVGDLQVYTLTGWGYSLQIPEGTLFWNYETGEWQEDSYFGYFTSIRVPVFVPEPPVPLDLIVEGPNSLQIGELGVFTATVNSTMESPLWWSLPWPGQGEYTSTLTQSVGTFSWGTPGVFSVTAYATEQISITHWVTVTESPQLHQVFLPYVSADRPPECLQYSPFEKLGWQTSEGYAVCSWQNPGSLNGIEPVRVQNERYNWLYAGTTGADATWLSPGDFADGLISLVTPTQAGIVVVCADDSCPEGFRRIYALWGFSYELSWGPFSGFWFDGNQWVSTPIWGEFTLFSVK